VATGVFKGIYEREALQTELWQLLLTALPEGTLRNVVASIVGAMQSAGDAKSLERIADKIAEGDLTPDQKFLLCDVMSLILHLQRSASITAAWQDRRHSALYGQQNADIHRAILDLAGEGLSASEIVAVVKSVAMDNVFTAHPTYIGDLDYSKVLRRLDRKIADRDPAAVADCLAELLSMNTLVAGRLTPQDETQYMRHYLANAYQSLPYLYRQIDSALAAAGLDDDYDPLALRLNLRFQSWGSSGDKDGNRNITVHSTEDAVKTHRNVMIHHYTEEFRTLRQLLPDDMVEEFDALRQRLYEQLEKIRSNSMAAPPEAVAHAYDELRQACEELYFRLGEENPKARRQVLGLRRVVGIFGLHLGQIEYRETAEELQFVLNHVIPAETAAQADRTDRAARRYSELTAEDREGLLDRLLMPGSSAQPLAKLRTALRRAQLNVPRKVKARDFAYADSGHGQENWAIFYHTIKRLEIAARNPDMFRGQVLAEVGDALQIKEMLLLLKITGADRSVRIIPLFEDPAVLSRVGEIVAQLHRDPVIYDYLVTRSLVEWDEAVGRQLVPALPSEVRSRFAALPYAQRRGELKAARQALQSQLARHGLPSLDTILVNQIQLAHSDNSRRGGAAGARAAIYRAHKDARAAGAAHGIGLQFFEGGSHTDAFRMGVRSYRSLVNLYDCHRFMKCTVQGMDLAQLFSSPFTIEAFLGENIANALQAERRARQSAEARGTDEDFRLRRALDHPAILEPVIAAVPSYADLYFRNPMLGLMLAQVFGYRENKLSGTLGSRSGGRSANRFEAIYLDPVKGTRTIGYSEVLQHGGLNPNFIGAGQLYQQLLSLSDPEREGGEDLTVLKQEICRDGASATARLNRLYRGSQALRDILDRIAFAIATTDFDEVWDRASHDYDLDGPDKVRRIRFLTEDRSAIAENFEEVKRPALGDLESEAARARESVTGFVAALELEFRQAARLVIEAIGREEVRLEGTPTADLVARARRVLPMYQDHFHALDVAKTVANAIERSIPADVRSLAYGKSDDRTDGITNGINKALHNLRDMATLVRPPFRNEWRNRGQA